MEIHRYDIPNLVRHVVEWAKGIKASEGNLCDWECGGIGTFVSLDKFCSHSTAEWYKCLGAITLDICDNNGTFFIRLNN